MTIATLDQVATFDDEGQIEGLQFDGRERALQLWREQQEEREFQELVARLQARNYARQDRQDPERLAKIQAAHARHRATGRPNQRARQRRRERYEESPIVNVCRECGREMVVPFDRPGPKRSKFCSRRCSARARGRNGSGTRSRPAAPSVAGRATDWLRLFFETQRRREPREML